MEDFVIENGVLKAYNGNESLIKIPEGVEVIDASFTCEAEVVVLPASLKKICHGAFHRFADFRGYYNNCLLNYLDESFDNQLVDIREMYELGFYEFDEDEDGRLERYIEMRMEDDEECTRDHAIEYYYQERYNDDAHAYYNQKADELLELVIDDINALLARDKEFEYQIIYDTWVERLQAGEI